MNTRFFPTALFFSLALTTTLASAGQGRYIVAYKTAQAATLAQSTMALTLSAGTGAGNKVPAQAQFLQQVGPRQQVVQLIGDEASRNQALNSLKADPNVLSVEEDLLAQPLAFPATAPNDPLWRALWALGPSVTNNSYHSKFASVWAQGFSGSKVVVAVIDTGVLPHADLGTIPTPNTSTDTAGTTVTGKLVSAGYDMISDCRVAGTCSMATTYANAERTPRANAFDLGDYVSVTDISLLKSAGSGNLSGCTSNTHNSWHGTHTSGIVAASGNNSVGIIGAAYGAQVLPVRVLGRCGGFTSDIQRGIRWAAGLAVDGLPTNPNPAKVINLSLGTRCETPSCTCPASYQSVINEVTNAGVTVVVASGNDGAAYPLIPANCYGVVTVGGSQRDGQIANYSNYGARLDLLAPGGSSAGTNSYCSSTLVDSQTQSICSLFNSGTTSYAANDSSYYQLHGTSMSAPLVSSAVALMQEAASKANLPSLKPAEIRTILRNTTMDMNGSCPSTCGCGTGILDTLAAVNAVSAGGTTIDKSAACSDLGKLPDTTLTPLSSGGGGCSWLFIGNQRVESRWPRDISLPLLLVLAFLMIYWKRRSLKPVAGLV